MSDSYFMPAGGAAFALTPYRDGDDSRVTLEVVIQAWAHAMHRKSQSTATATAYNDTMARYRRFLEANGLRLDDPDERALAVAAQAFASTPWGSRKQTVKANTYNQRLAILSSFYRFANRYGYHVATPYGVKAIGNPVAIVERARVSDYAGAAALEAAEVKRRIQAIDRSSLMGKRDYALLAVALQTGRRLSELAGMRLEDLAGDGEALTVHFPRTKGGKEISDTLPRSVSRAVLEWLEAARAAYPGRTLEAVWLNLSRWRNGRPLGKQSVADICARYLGTPKVHTTRHTFAHEMERAGASVSEIQRRLGHSSLTTTTRYLTALTSATNSKAVDIATAFGFEETE